MARKAQKRRKATRQRGRAVDWRPAFLAAYALTGVVLDACAAVPVDHSTVYRECKSNPQFAEDFDDARKMGARVLEAEASRRAIQGVQKLKFYEGMVITVPSGKMLKREDGSEYPEYIPYVEHEYSDRLLELLLKRHFPDEYREKLAQVSVSASATAVAGISDADLEQAQERVRHYLTRLATPGNN